MALDLVIRGGAVVTAEKSLRCDVGIQGGKLVELKSGLEGKRVIDARDRLVMPGGVDSHCHVHHHSVRGAAPR